MSSGRGSGGSSWRGHAGGASVSPLPPRASGVTKPVVFYGTSITHGDCASRPGLSFVNIIGRELDVSVVNLGFSDSGRGEIELSDYLAAGDGEGTVDGVHPNDLGMRQMADGFKEPIAQALGLH